MKILVLGASGMLGSAMINKLSETREYEVFGSARSSNLNFFFKDEVVRNIITGVDVLNTKELFQLLKNLKPNVVINCVGLVKQLKEAKDPLEAIPINALLPHQLAEMCEQIKSRLIHISTDCVFSGLKGNYIESDYPDASDLYGRSKLLGEVDYPHTLTLRTSIIGQELRSKNGLISWFLDQSDHVRGYTKAIFSGLPTDELARIISDIILPSYDLYGLYHVSAEPISKYELLMIVNREFNKKIHIEPDETFVIDRSLNSERFREVSKYIPPKWPELIKQMKVYNEYAKTF